jgi:hypothetical protein
MLLLTIAAAAALQPAPTAGEPQRLDPMNCSATGNYITKETLRFAGASFRFSGRITAGQRRADDFAPRAMISLLQEERPEEELSAVLSVQPATPRRYDVTLRRLINDELRERSVVGRVPTAEPVAFEIQVTGNGEAVFRLGRHVSRVPLGDLRPSAIVIGCSSGDFQFENLQFEPDRA